MPGRAAEDTTLLYTGTAGWSVASCYADLFPTGGTHLVRYASVLNAVEINSSFYRPHRRATYERWAASVPTGFRFSVKMPKAITHESKLIDCDAHLDRFLDETAGLGQKRGVLLVQLPPSLRFDSTAVERFLVGLRVRSEVAVACEPRHPTWFSEPADALLRAYRVARVGADPAPADGAASPGGWDGIVYLRLHGSPTIYYSDYDKAALRMIGDRLRARRSTGAPVWCIFDNTAAFHALGNALTMTRMVLEPGFEDCSDRFDPA